MKEEQIIQGILEKTKKGEMVWLIQWRRKDREKEVVWASGDYEIWGWLFPVLWYKNKTQLGNCKELYRLVNLQGKQAAKKQEEDILERIIQTEKFSEIQVPIKETNWQGHLTTIAVVSSIPASLLGFWWTIVILSSLCLIYWSLKDHPCIKFFRKS